MAVDIASSIEDARRHSSVAQPPELVLNHRVVLQAHRLAVQRMIRKDARMNAINDTLVRNIYEAALEPSRIPPVLDQLRDVFHADVVVQRVGIAPGHYSVLSSEQDPAHVTAYLNHFSRIDPWVGNVRKIETAGVINCSTLMPYDAFRRTEYYNDFFSKQGLHWGLASIIDPATSVASYVTVMRARRKDDFDAADNAAMNRLMPHLQASTKIQRRLAAIADANLTLERTLDRLNHGVVVLGHDDAVIYMNRAADGLLAGSEVLRIEKARLRAVDPAADKVLQGMFARTCSPRPPDRASSTMRLGTACTQGAVDLLICPFMPRERLDARADAAAIVFLHAVQGHTHGIDTFLHQRYGLTPAEIRCAIALASGESVADIAERHAVSPLTVRAQVRALYTKMQLKRQGALIAALNRDIALLEMLSTNADEIPAGDG